MIPAILGAALGAIGRRIAGGLLSRWLGRDVGDWPARAGQGALMGVVALSAGLTPLWCLAVAAATAAGATVGLFGAMVPRSARDIALLLVHGLGATAPVAGVLWAAGAPLWWGVLVAGALRPACYSLARVAPLACPVLGCQADDPPPTAELLAGALMGVAVACAG